MISTGGRGAKKIKSAPISLNKAQARALAIRVARALEVLGEMESYLASRAPGQATGKRLNGKLQEIKSTLADTAKQFNLDVDQHNDRRRLLGQMAMVWVLLEEVKPDRLSAYGEVAPGIDECLGPRIDRIIRLFKDVEKSI